jgi:cytochrome c oxidase subunit III
MARYKDLESSIGTLPEEPRQTLAMHPLKFALWLFITSITMMFAALTSAYLVKRSDGEWLQFDLPPIFWINSVILVLSSAAMHWAYICAKRDNLNLLKVAMTVTVVLGFGFLVGQWYSWEHLEQMRVFFRGNPAGSFVYVLTGLHAFHLITGVIYLLIVLGASFQYKIHSKRLTRIEMCATYWHFLDVLWLYLFVFLLVNH